MSQDDAKARDLRVAAAQNKAILLQASAGYVSDLARRELWRMKEQPAKTWAGYNPQEVAEAIRVALRENHFNMQGFLPKKPGDYRYDAEQGEFRIVLRQRTTTHSLLMKGRIGQRNWLGWMIPYARTQEGMDFFNDYGALATDPRWGQILQGLTWQEAWLTAPEGESRCLWDGSDHRPYAPVMRHMPEWHRGVHQALFLTQRPS